MKLRKIAEIQFTETGIQQTSLEEYLQDKGYVLLITGTHDLDILANVDDMKENGKH